MNDFSLWEEIKKSISPLRGKGILSLYKKDLPPKLRVRKAEPKEISYTLNLHGLTVQEAYDAVKKFITKHSALSSKKITIITGKGLHKVGAIKKEMPLWLETPVFKEKITGFSWKNDGGAMDITLRKIKK